MPADATAVGYRIWGADHSVYGPVELPTLVEWIKDERVVADTWLYLARSDSWEQAARVPELRMFFNRKPAAGPSHAPAAGTAAYHHVRLLAGLNDEQVEKLFEFAELQTIPAGAQVAKQGDPAQAMFVLLEGELRVRAMVEGHETSLGNLNAGEFFGEMALFDHGPRSQDVFAVQDSTLLKLDGAKLEKLAHDAPELAAPILHSLAKALVARVRADNKRYRDSICFIRPVTAR